MNQSFISQVFSFRAWRLRLLILFVFFKRNWRNIFVIIFLCSVVSFVVVRFDLLNFETNVVSQGIVGTYQQHDLPSEVTMLLSSGLVEVDAQGKVIPKLASKWSNNEEVTEFTFELHNDLRWFDGSDLKASDLEFSIPNTEINIIDDKTIQFKLQDSYSAFPTLLTKPLFKKGTLMGIGPYNISKIEKSRIFISKLILEPQDLSYPTLIIRMYPNEKTAITGFALGEVHSLLGVNSSEFAEEALFKTEKRVDFTKVATIFYNTSDPVLSIRPFRQALSYAAPLIEGEVEANNPYPPNSWAFFKDSKDYLSKPDEAKTALERAKAASTEEMIQKEVVLTTTPALENVGKKIVAAWKDIGVNAVLRVESGIPQKFQALLILQSIPADPDQYFLWHSTQESTNLSRYSDDCCPTSARVDKDLEDGRKLVKEEERKEKYFDFQRVLLEDSPATFLYFPKYNIVYLSKAEAKLQSLFPLQFSSLMSVEK